MKVWRHTSGAVDVSTAPLGGAKDQAQLVIGEVALVGTALALL